MDQQETTTHQQASNDQPQNSAESSTELVEALIKARLEFNPVKKDGKNPRFGNRYATLDAILEEVTPKLAKHGLFIIHFLKKDQASLFMVTTLIHKGGEKIQIIVPLLGSERFDNMQQLGSAITYARRYSLQMLLGIQAEEDDDGELAVSSTTHQPLPHLQKTQASLPPFVKK